MEFTLETAPDDGGGSAYLSVRAGGQRKLCAVKPGQRINFAGLDAPGKIKVEVLEQTGIVVLPSDFPATAKVVVPRSSGRPVEISCRRTKDVKSSVPSLPSLTDAQAGQSDEPLDRQRASYAQRQYLEQQNVDEIVEEVVRELLMNQPQDARAFLRRHFGGYPEDPAALTTALGDTCRELELWAKHHRNAGKDLEVTRSDMKESVDQKTQEAAWWKLRCEQQFDAVGEIEMLQRKAEESDAQRRAAESAAGASEKDLRDLKQASSHQASALEREVARLGEQVQRQAGELARIHADSDNRVRSIQRQSDEAGAATKRRLAQVEFQLKASVRSGVNLQHRCRRIKERLRSVAGDTSLEADSDSEEADFFPMRTSDDWQPQISGMSQDSLQFSGNLSMSPVPREDSPAKSPGPIVPPIDMDRAQMFNSEAN